MENFRNNFLIVFIVLLTSSVHAADQQKRCLIYLISENGHKVKLNSEIADTPSGREKGLMFKKSMKESDGMLFVFDREQKLNFWMKNTYIPLDIAYIDKNGIINEIYHMKPLDVSLTYNSMKPAMFALEVNLGWFERHKIKTGSKIEFNGCLSKQNSLLER
jgi:hypothetical protein